MKKLGFIRFIALSLWIIVLASGCKKEKNPAPSNDSLVLKSEKIVLNNWKKGFLIRIDDLNYEYSFYHEVPLEWLDTKIVEEGMINVYLRRIPDPSENWTVLPTEESSSNQNYNFIYRFGNKKITIIHFGTIQTAEVQWLPSETKLNGNYEIRVVALTEMGKKTYSTVNFMNYNEVKSTFQLSE